MRQIEFMSATFFVYGMDWFIGETVILVFLKETFELSNVFSHERIGSFAKSSVIPF